MNAGAVVIHMSVEFHVSLHGHALSCEYLLNALTKVPWKSELLLVHYFIGYIFSDSSIDFGNGFILRRKTWNSCLALWQLSNRARYKKQVTSNFLSVSNFQKHIWEFWEINSWALSKKQLSFYFFEQQYVLFMCLTKNLITKVQCIINQSRLKED